MPLSSEINVSFQKGLARLGFEAEEFLFLIEDGEEASSVDPQIPFLLAKAAELGASAIFVRRQMNGTLIPQVYLYDFTDKPLKNPDHNISEIQKKLWSDGGVPLACFFFKEEIKIIDCTAHPKEDFTPKYLIDNLKLVGKADELYNEQFAVKIKTGLFWEEEEFKNTFQFRNSAYDALIENIRFVNAQLKENYTELSNAFIHKLIVKSILIKYLEERIDNNGQKLLSEKYFKKYEGAQSFNDVLRNGKLVDLLNDFDRDFNGNVFKWTNEEQEKLQQLDLNQVADLLATNKKDLTSNQIDINFPVPWRYFEFKYIPVELISRLYEEFLETDKSEKGAFYTPSHLANLLVDECLPLSNYKNIDPLNYKVLDPACGSGIFLVVAFKRLVQIWRLQNNMDAPDSEKHLKPILKNIYGVDQEKEAVQLASFSLSLALCDELKPLKILNELKFDNLLESNLIESDFFDCTSIKSQKFDLLIGNPPFVRGGSKQYGKWKLNKQNISIPGKQIALKFLAESFSYLKESGLSCMIIKASSLLYNSSSGEYKKALFSNYNVEQVFDFTALARNKTLWDNGADVASAAIFAKNKAPDQTTNILHLTFRRNKVTKDRLFFEIDEYDLHFIDRQTAIDNPYIWKINIVGGGRIRNTLNKLRTLPTVKDFLDKENVIYGEGIGGGKSLPNKAFKKGEIDLEFNTEIYQSSFGGKKDKLVFSPPNLLIKENIDLPIALNRKSLKFSNEIVSFHTQNLKLLKRIHRYIEQNISFLKFSIICMSGKTLVIKNTACLQKDILNMPLDFSINLEKFLSNIDLRVIKEVNEVLQFSLRLKNSYKLFNKIKKNEFKEILENYGQEFIRILNPIYGNSKRQFSLTDVISLDNQNLIAVVFRFQNGEQEPKFHRNHEEVDIKGLAENEISQQLNIKRIVRLYPQKDVVVFVKPNLYKYWMSLTAYRDADKYVAELVKSGF